MAEERSWTWEDIVHLPEQEMPEIIDGKPYYRAAPRMKHSVAAWEVSAALLGMGPPLRAGWWILPELDVRLGPNRVVRPDLCGYRKERLPGLVDDWPLDLRPDWVCEILSPSKFRYDRSTKGRVYDDAGIPWYWLVDTQERMVEVWELVGGRWSVLGCFGDDDKLALPPFDGLEFEVGQLFGQAPTAP
jgi:Uma2 family endonuclease